MLKGIPKLSERMESLSTGAASSGDLDSDFLDRLRAEEDRISALPARPTSVTSKASQVFFWGLTGGMLLVLATTSLGSGQPYASASMFLWKELVSTSMSLYWLAWVRPGMSLSDLVTPLTTLLDSNVRIYVIDTVLPQVYKTVKRIVVTELWNAYFRRMWKELEGLFVTTSDNDDVIVTASNQSTESSNSHDPKRWLYEKHKIFVDILERGTKKVIQSSLQKQLQSSFHSVSSTMMVVLRQASSRGVVGLRPGDFISM